MGGYVSGCTDYNNFVLRFLAYPKSRNQINIVSNFASRAHALCWRLYMSLIFYDRQAGSDLICFESSNGDV